MCERLFVRWDNLTLDSEEQRSLPGYRDAALVRRFDAPEALDVRFYEVRAKSALNRVPERSAMPFRWTINPYRGCTHACSYCLAGDTPILMADGRTRRLDCLRVGDEIYGTVLVGPYRRYVKTRVLDHWSSIKPACRVTLDDGRQIVASADHRFLTRRGWKHVLGADHGTGRRPHLTVGARLLGTDPAITRKRDLEGKALKASGDRSVVAIEPLSCAMRLYDITTGTGDFIADGVVSHNCFARPTHTYLGFGAGRDFEREIVVKVNVPEVLRTELARPSWQGEHVALGTNTDPYQWVESRYRLMPGIWAALRDAANPCSILTKSPLLLRDLPLLLEVAERTRISACLSVPTLDERAWRATEPHTPSPRARLDAVGKLNAAGIPTGILIAPLMPGINDAPEQVEPILAAAAEAGATSVGSAALHVRGEVRTVFFAWLRAHRPDLVERYERLYRRGAYLPEDERRRLDALVPPTAGARRWRERDEPRPAPAGAARPPPAVAPHPSLF